MKKQFSKPLIFFLFFLAIFQLSLCNAVNAQIMISEDFDDEVFDTNTWENKSFGSGATNEVNGSLKLTAQNGVYGRGYFTSNFYLVGDFDIQIDFSLISFTNYWSGAGIYVFTEDRQTYMNIYIAAYGIGGKAYTAIYQIDGTLYVPPGCSTSTNDVSGTFRLVRVGSQMTSYYWSNGDWEQLVTSEVTDEKLSFEVAAGNTPAATPYTEVHFDNLIIDADSFAPACD